MTGLRACASNACVEVKFVTACDSSACVAVAVDGDRVLVRNSARPELVLEFTLEEWDVFLGGVRRGVFEMGE